MKMLDLFAGIGGFSYAAHKLVGGFTTTQFVEIDPYCQSVLRKNFPDIPIHDDIKTFTGKPGQFQVITAGFPCQDLSVAGKQRGIGEGTRSGLFYEIIRLLGEIQPEFVLFENVRNLLSHEGGTTFQEVLFQIAKAGYDAEWSIISAKDMGACHLRQRLWILAYPTGKYKNRTESSIQTGRDATVGFSAANPNDDGSSSSKRIRVDGQADSSTQEGQNQTSQSKRSSKSKDSRTVQQTAESSASNRKPSLSSNFNGEISSSSNSDSIRCGGGSSEGRSIRERELLQREQERREMGSKTEGLSINSSDSDEQGLEGRILQVDQELQEVGSSAQEDTSSTSNSDSSRTQSHSSEQTQPIWTNAFLSGEKKRTLEPDWRRYVSEPTLRRGDDGLSNRMARLKALGNSILPDCAAVPLQRIKDLRSL